jgi:probable F420-dependent oxidoreductase
VTTLRRSLLAILDGVELGKVGIWFSGTWRVTDSPLDATGEMEALGYSAPWSSGRFEPGLSKHFERQLSTTTHLVVASGIVSIWPTSPQEIGEAVADLDARYPGRFLLGLGASHAPVVADYTRPYSKMVDFLDALDSAGPSVAKDRRMLAALGPRMLELAGERSAGAHPYFVPVEHTVQARARLGPGPLLAPEVTVVLERDPSTARALARTFTEGYLGLPNYANNLRSLGFGDDDLAGAGSDRLVDAVVGWGDTEAIAARVHEHHEAGADHVCVQVIPATQGSFPLTEYRELAAALLAD